MNCRMDGDVYGYAVFGISVLSCLAYGLMTQFMDNEFRREAELTKVALHYALNETQILRNRLSNIQNICNEHVENTIEGTVSSEDK